MIKRASLVVLCSYGLIYSPAANAQMQQGYANDKPDVTVDRSVLQDLKGYQPPPMFGGDFMPPTSNRLSPPKKVEPPPAVQVVPPAQPSYKPAATPIIPPAAPAPSQATMTAPNAEDLLNHPTQNFHVLTERNASMTAPAPAASAEPLDGPLLPLPDDDNDPAKAHAKAVKAKKTVEEKVDKKSPAKVEKKENKKDDKKKDPPKKDEPKQQKSEEVIKPTASKKPEPPKAGIQVIEATKIKPVTIQPNPNAYRPKAPQSMPAVPPIQVEKNILPPISDEVSGSPLPNLPPPTATSEKIEKPSIGVRMMDAALERQIETDDSKIKEQLAATKVKTLSKEAPDPVIASAKASSEKKSKTSQKTLVFKGQDVELTDKMKTQIKAQILPDLKKDETSRIQILSFASKPNGDDYAARRISLSRALAVRDYLKSANIDVSRIDLRALEADGNSVPPDKVDVILLK